MASLSSFIGGSCLLFVSCAISSAGGIGGGGLNVPILLVVYGFDYDQAVVFSLVAVLGNTLSQVYLNSRKHHPQDKTRPLIYWDAILCLLPAQLGGSSIGAMIVSSLPETILLCVAIAVLLYAAVKTSKKAMKLYRIETVDVSSSSSMKREHDVVIHDASLSPSFTNASSYAGNHMISQGLSTPLLPDNYDSDDMIRIHAHDRKHEALEIVYNPMESQTDHHPHHPTSASSSSPVIIESSSAAASPSGIIYPYMIILSLCVVWLGYALVSIIITVIDDKCSAAYFAMTFLFIPFLCLFIYYSIMHVIDKQQHDGHIIHDGDINFTDISYLPPAFAFIIGVLCSLLGIGGGELMGPLLLTLKVLPQVSSATTSTMSLFNTSSNILHYAVMGRLPSYASALIIFAVGLLGGYAGRYIALYISIYYRRPSITVIMLAAVLYASICMIVYFIAAQDRDLSFHAFCP